MDVTISLNEPAPDFNEVLKRWIKAGEEFVAEMQKTIQAFNELGKIDPKWQKRQRYYRAYARVGEAMKRGKGAKHVKALGSRRIGKRHPKKGTRAARTWGRMHQW